jgi:hypothetical protein
LILQDQSRQNLYEQPQQGQLQQASLASLYFEERLIALRQDLKTDMKDSVKAIIAESAALLANKAHPPNSISQHDCERSFQPLLQMQRAISRMEQQLRTYI